MRERNEEEREMIDREIAFVRYVVAPIVLLNQHHKATPQTQCTMHRHPTRSPDTNHCSLSHPTFPTHPS